MVGSFNGTYMGLLGGTGAGGFYGLDGGLYGNILGGMQAETIAWYRQLALPKPSYNYIGYVDMLICNLKEFGIWSQLDRFWIFATEQQAHARVNLVNRGGDGAVWPTNITEHNSPTWTRLKGYTGNGTNMYLDTGYVPSNSSILSLNNASIGLWALAKPAASSGSEMGSNFTGNTASLSVTLNNTTKGMVCTVNDASNNGSAANSGKGHAAGVRTNSTSNVLYSNGNAILTTTANSVSVPNFSTYILAVNNQGTAAKFSSAQIAMAYVGSGKINQFVLFTSLQKFAMQTGFYS